MSRAVEFSFTISIHAEVHNRLAVGIEDVHSVVIALGDDDPTFRVYGETTGTFELSKTVAFRRKFSKELSLACENLKEVQKRIKT